MGVQPDGGAVLHEVSPRVDVEVEGVVHQEQPVRSLLSHDVVRVPVELLRRNQINVNRKHRESLLPRP